MMGFQPHGTDKLTGAMLGMRRWLPLLGGGGGTPGACTEFIVHRGDGVSEEVPTHASGVELGPDDVFEFRCASGGGFGDALDRDPVEVRADIERGVFDAEVAERVYGVIFDDAGAVDDAATDAHRAEIGRDRLDRAQPAPTPLTDTSLPDVAGPSDRRRAALPRRRATGRARPSVRAAARRSRSLLITGPTVVPCSSRPVPTWVPK